MAANCSRLRCVNKSELVGTLLGTTARNIFIMVVCRIFVSLVLNSYTEGACYRQ